MRSLTRRSITACTASDSPCGEAGVEEGLEPVERQVQRVQDQVGRLVVGVVGAVAEEQLAPR